MTTQTCPRPSKRSHPSRWQAENAMNNCWKSPRPGSHLPVRVYHCECGAWHLTHKGFVA